MWASGMHESRGIRTAHSKNESLQLLLARLLLLPLLPLKITQAGSWNGRMWGCTKREYLDLYMYVPT